MRSLLLRLLKLKDRPDVPPGSSESVSMFRASPRFFWYSMLGWAAGQLGALFGILVPLGVLDRLLSVRISDWMGAADVRQYLPEELVGAEIGLDILGMAWRIHVGGLINALEIMALGIYLVQLVVSFLLLRLAWEMRWYVVTDTAIRIREGLVRTREQTLTIAKIQNLKVHQGPLQRLFGIADLEVQTAGGGSSTPSPGDKDGKSSARLGRFRGLEDVESLRDRLRALQGRGDDSGLGEATPRRQSQAAGSGRAAHAARAMLQETRLLRQSLEESWARPTGRN